MLHFDGHTLSIKKVTFSMKSGEYLEKGNIYGVNFDSGICISMEYIHVKEYIIPNQVFILISIFVQKKQQQKQKPKKKNKTKQKRE